MKRELHFVSREESVLKWSGPVSALCGKEVPEARPVLALDLAVGTVEVPKMRLGFCRACWGLAAVPVEGVAYIYGILPLEEALKVNGNTDELA